MPGEEAGSGYIWVPEVPVITTPSVHEVCSADPVSSAVTVVRAVVLRGSQQARGPSCPWPGGAGPGHRPLSWTAAEGPDWDTQTVPHRQIVPGLLWPWLSSCSLSACCVPGTVVSAGHTARVTQSLALLEPTWKETARENTEACTQCSPETGGCSSKEGGKDVTDRRAEPQHLGRGSGSAKAPGPRAWGPGKSRGVLAVSRSLGFTLVSTQGQEAAMGWPRPRGRPLLTHLHFSMTKTPWCQSR